jgi:hypothetical protein
MKKLFDVLEATSSAKDMSTSLSAIYALRNVKMDVRSPSSVSLSLSRLCALDDSTLYDN